MKTTVSLIKADVGSLAGHLRRMGEFQPSTLGAEAMEYTTLPQVLKDLEPRFKKL